jgi:3-oxoadipate CoA-transferase alpha subunit
VPLGDIPPEQVVTPGIFVDRVVEVTNPGSEREMIERDFRYIVGHGA